MKKKSCMVTVLLIVLSTIVCVLIVVIKENPKCSVEFLVLDEDEMSEGWRNDLGFLPPALDALGAQEAFLMTMKNDGNGAISHAVYQYRNRWLAAFHLWFDRETFFPSVGWTWKELEEANNLPLHAEQQQIKCGTANPGFSLLGNQCTAVLRYGPYISDFGSSIDEGGDISIEEFVEIVLKIDERFTSCVE